MGLGWDEWDEGYFQLEHGHPSGVMSGGTRVYVEGCPKCVKPDLSKAGESVKIDRSELILRTEISEVMSQIGKASRQAAQEMALLGIEPQEDGDHEQE